MLVTDQAARQKKWDDLEVHVKAAKKARDYGALKSLYFAQAAHLYKYGSDFFPLSQEARRCELLDYKSSGMVDRVEIIATADSCSACKALDGKTFTVKQALKQMPIPVAGCSWCKCCYAANFD